MTIAAARPTKSAWPTTPWIAAIALIVEAGTG
jgi:hypothetical protein